MIKEGSKENMKLLFVQGGSRIKVDSDGNLYTDGNLNLKVWNRYMDLSDEKMTAVFRQDSQDYTADYAKEHLNAFDHDLMDCLVLPDLYHPKSNYFSLSKRKYVRHKIREAVERHDLIIIRSLGNLYVEYAIQAAEELHKPYLVEVTGVYWDSSWYHSLGGKVLALPRELSAKKCILKAPYAVYVTEKALQKRYPCKGKTLGCSDVELMQLDDEILDARIEKISKCNGKIVLGTAGFLHFKTKGQHDVIKALSILKKKGYTNYIYQLIGIGDDTFLREMAKKYDVEDQVQILGGKTHEDVFLWMDSLDFYVQPSYQEGLCRSIVEAMSRACPIICSNAGGNGELIDSDYVFHRGNLEELIACLNKMNVKEMGVQAMKNFKAAHKYSKDRLDQIRSDFYTEFVSDVKKSL